MTSDFHGRSVTSQGDVVGEAIGGMNVRGAFLWQPDDPNGGAGSMINLQTLLSPTDAAQWQLQGARGINDYGQIVGWGRFEPDGAGPTLPVFPGYLLTPVPEPASVWLSLH